MGVEDAKLYRNRTAVVRAYQLKIDQAVTTVLGNGLGRAGDWMAETEAGWVLSPKERFELGFVPVEGNDIPPEAAAVDQILHYARMAEQERLLAIVRRVLDARVMNDSSMWGLATVDKIIDEIRSWDAREVETLLATPPPKAPQGM